MLKAKRRGKAQVKPQQIVGFIVMLVGAMLVAFTAYKGLGGVVIAIGIAIASGIKGG